AFDGGIAPAANDLIVKNHYGADGNFSGESGFLGEAQRHPHVGFVTHLMRIASFADLAARVRDRSPVCAHLSRSGGGCGAGVRESSRGKRLSERHCARSVPGSGADRMESVRAKTEKRLFAHSL